MSALRWPWRLSGFALDPFRRSRRSSHSNISSSTQWTVAKFRSRFGLAPQWQMMTSQSSERSDFMPTPQRRAASGRLARSRIASVHGGCRSFLFLAPPHPHRIRQLLEDRHRHHRTRRSIFDFFNSIDPDRTSVMSSGDPKKAVRWRLVIAGPLCFADAD